jgi:hypothetical protein
MRKSDRSFQLWTVTARAATAQLRYLTILTGMLDVALQKRPSSTRRWHPGSGSGLDKGFDLPFEPADSPARNPQRDRELTVVDQLVHSRFLQANPVTNFRKAEQA